MKIGYISPTKFNKPGGHRTYGIRTIETLCQKHAVTVFNIDSEYNKNNFDYYSNYEDYIQDEEETGVKNQAIPAHLRQVATSLRTMDIIRRKELDLIYVDGSFFIRPIVGYIASQLHNIPVIIGVSDQHSRDIITGNKFYEILNGPVRKHILKNADHLILESQIILDDLKEQGINPNDFTVVPIAAGINLERFNRWCPSVSTRKTPTVLYVGRDSDISLLLASIPEVRKDVPDVEFRFAGFSREDIDEEIPEGTTFLGVLPRNEVYKEMKKSHICVLPYSDSATAGRPMKLSEYMASGSCVVTTNQPYATQMINDGENGIVTEADKDDFAEGILRALNNKYLRKELGSQAKSDISTYKNIKKTRLLNAVESIT